MALSRIDMDIADAVMEIPIGFTIGRRQFFIYPMTLGKTFVVSRVLEQLDLASLNVDEKLSSFLLLATASTKRKECLKLIAYSSLPGDECLDTRKVERRIRQLRRLRDSEVATLVTVILTSDTTSKIRKHFSFDKEQKQLNRIMRVKARDGGSIVFGGKSIWGNLIDFACERYGWSLHYVLWEVSYANLNFLMVDHIRSVFLTKEERKKAHITGNNVIINGNDADELRSFIASQSWR